MKSRVDEEQGCVEGFALIHKLIEMNMVYTHS